jgi:hypothetical protein
MSDQFDLVVTADFPSRTKEPAVGERHLLVRVIHDTAEPKSTSLKLGPDESLRVLLEFADRL